MQRLIELLREVESFDDIPDDKNAILNTSDSGFCCKEIASIATDLFISKDGDPLFEKMDELQTLSGYYIFPGERDRCGWLTACLQTKKGVIVFG